MYVLALIFVLSENYEQREVIGAFSSLTQCEEAAQSYTSKVKCYFLNPDKGSLEVGEHGITDMRKNSSAERQ